MDRLGRLLLQLFDASVGLAERLGFKGSRWEWKRMRWRSALEAKLADWENVSRSVAVETRMCRECRSLVPRQLAECPDCGSSMRGVSGGGTARLLGLVLPDVGSLSVTMAIVSLNVVLMLVALWQQATVFGASGWSPSAPVLFALGAKWTPAIFGGQYQRLVTAIFLHGGILHLVFNSYTLLSLGPLVEAAFGRRKFFLIYLGTGVASFLASSLMSPHSLSIGASGALFGLMGFVFVFGRYRSGTAGRAIADQLGRWILLGALMLFMPGIDNAAHAGGLAAGALCGLFVDAAEPRSGPADLWLSVAAWTGFAIVVASFVLIILAYPETLAAVLNAS